MVIIFLKMTLFVTKIVTAEYNFYMSITEFIKGELKGWGKTERKVFPLGIILIAGISIYMHDITPAIISAICGICATITAGKGKISCYFFGIISNLCYGYISFENAFWGNLVLNMLYYLPMQFVGISQWKKHMKKETQVIYKTKLSLKERILYFIIISALCIGGYYLLLTLKDSNPFMDSVTTILSVFAFLLTVKRCVEQWYVWTIVNALCVLMWLGAFMHGSHCFATVLMWSTYFVLGLYFLKNWNKELQSESNS